MLRHKNKIIKTRNAQTLLEYTMVIGIIVIVIFAMNPMIKRGIQGIIKVVADQVGNQKDSDQAFDDSGHLDNSYTVTRTTIGKNTTDFLGTMTYGYNDSSLTHVESNANLGFSPN